MRDSCIALRFKIIDRTTPTLLPPGIREWVAEDDRIHFVMAAVERLPIPAFAVNHKGRGDEPFPPRLLLALLVCCHGNGILGSRHIERATWLHHPQPAAVAA